MTLQHLSGRCRMGDPKAAARCRVILRRGLAAPPGSREREQARLLARMISNKVGTRQAFLPQPGDAPKTELAARLLAIFKRHGGRIHLRARG